ncbi:MAG: efflux RND transporter periplasmic adaptor subunit [Verrucomicrobiota bacterium]
MILNAVSLMVAVALVAGCTREPERAATQPLPTVAVRTQTVERKAHVATEEVVGTVRAKLRAVVAAKISGRIERLAVASGDAVKTGQLLAQLDAGEIRAKLDQAKAILEQADNDLRRFTKLLAQQAVTPAEFEAVQARQRVAKAAVAEAQTMLDYARVTAPFDGVVTRKLADTGDLATPGRPLVELEDPKQLRLEADVPETLLERVRTGDELLVSVVSAGAELRARVSEMAPAADTVSRTFLAKLDLPVDARLRAGQFGRVLIPVSESISLRAPTNSVLKRGQMELAFVVTNQTAQLRLVKTGKVIGGEVEILSGLAGGERVVVGGIDQLADGQRVQVRP